MRATGLIKVVRFGHVCDRVSVTAFTTPLAGSRLVQLRPERSPTITIWSLGCRRRFGAH